MRKYIIAALTLICLKGIAQKKLPLNNSDVFDRYVDSALQLWKTPGLSVAVVKDGSVVFKKGYGVTELGKPAPFTTSTLSMCASTTKAMTAVCMGMLVDEGKISWSDKVSDVYPALKLYDNYANSEMTVLDLFTHNTGLGNADWLWVEGYPLDTIINKMRLIKPAYSFRSSFIYQNLMYMIAGEVIRKVSGKPWDEFIKERLFTPLGMVHTYPNYAASVNEPSHITPHFMYDDSVVKPIQYIETKGIDAAGGVWSCADDINKWLLCLLDSTKINGTRLLKPETYTMLFTPHSMVTPEEFYPTARLTKPHWTTYGLGWFQEDYRGKMVNFHTGSLDGAVAICGLINDEHFGIYIFSNRDHTELRHALMYKAMDLWVFNDNSNDWSAKMFAMYKALNDTARKHEKDFEAKRVLNTQPSLGLKEYAGTYSNELYGDAWVKLEGDSLTLSFPNNINVKLSHWHYNTFLGKFDYQWYGKDWLTFNIDVNGKVSSFNFMGMTYGKKE
ncbi:MAG TPA: serine hydrolase [Chitinophagaceae bacterium]|nr:serine hydrolase [Chitinophagaceae bacterium]